MSINPEIFIHESDRAALNALKAIPGFAPLLKAFMKVWNEKQFKIMNMSTNLKLSENQMKKYYDMLIPICEKIGIAVPELYLELNPYPNAYTYGDTSPFIVMTSGLIETMPEELIPTVLAHECGHIACHHTLYTTMGRYILRGVSAAVSGIGQLATLPIMMAFAYWMRCSEYSADRVAAVCDGNADKIVEMCMRFAGYDKDVPVEGNIDAFLEQGKEYKELIADSMFNKTLEFIMFNMVDHPLNAVRGYNCLEWTKTDSFENTIHYLNEDNEGISHDIIPIVKTPDNYVGRNYIQVVEELTAEGFTNIETHKVIEKGVLTKEGQVLTIQVGDIKKYNIGDWIRNDEIIQITYYEAETDEEAAAAHPGMVKVGVSSKTLIGQVYTDVVSELKEIGFYNIRFDVLSDLKMNVLDKGKENKVSKIAIGESEKFDKNDWFDISAPVTITYHAKGND